jgi:hypothetical protein
VLKAAAGTDVLFTIHTAGIPGAHLEVIEDGRTVAVLPSEAKTYRYTSDGARHWFRLNARAAAGTLLLLGNPIYINF